MEEEPPEVAAILPMEEEPPSQSTVSPMDCEVSLDEGEQKVQGKGTGKKAKGKGTSGGEVAMAACAPSSFAAMSTDAAKDLLNSEELLRMKSQKNVIVVNEKRQYTLLGNERVLGYVRAHMGSSTDLPSLYNFMVFVRGLNSHFMSSLCEENSGRLYEAWVRHNGKMAKHLYATLIRKEKRPPKPVAKKAGLTKPALKPPLLHVNLTKECEAVEMAEKVVSVGGNPCPSIGAQMSPGENQCPSAASVGAQMIPGGNQCPSTPSVGAPMTPEGTQCPSTPTAAPLPRRISGKRASPDSDVIFESMTINSNGERVLALQPSAKCFVCKKCIRGPEAVVVTGADLENDVKHLTCLAPNETMGHARLAKPAEPTAGAALRANIKKEKAAKKSKLETLPSTWTEDVAERRHNELMRIAAPLRIVGPDGAWNLKYEPKRVDHKSWMRTRHQVVLRWKFGTSKSWPFEFSEWVEGNDDDFKVRVLQAFGACRRDQGAY